MFILLGKKEQLHKAKCLCASGEALWWLHPSLWTVFFLQRIKMLTVPIRLSAPVQKTTFTPKSGAVGKDNWNWGLFAEIYVPQRKNFLWFYQFWFLATLICAGVVIPGMKNKWAQLGRKGVSSCIKNWCRYSVVPQLRWVALCFLMLYCGHCDEPVWLHPHKQQRSLWLGCRPWLFLSPNNC